MVEKVEKNCKKYEIFEEIERVVFESIDAIRKRRYQKLGKLMIKNHESLRKLGVVSRRAEKIVSDAIASGAFGAKTTGGSNTVIAVGIKKEEFCTEENVEPFVVRCGTPL